MFGFIDGADIGNEGEKAFEYEATGSFQKRGGRYSAIEHELAFEHVLTQNFSYELSAHGLTHSISGVEDLDDRNSTQFSGASAKLRYLIIGRGPGSPFGLTVSAEPEWSRVDGTDGTAVQAYSSTFKIVADTELIANRLYRRDQSDLRAGGRQARRHRHVGAQFLGRPVGGSCLPCHADFCVGRRRGIRSGL